MPRQRLHRAAGFTLIELMIAVVIVAIIASIAYPNYLDSVRKSRRAEVKTSLLEIAALQEKFYSRNSQYSDDLTELNVPNSDNVTATTLDTSNGYYQVTLTNATSGTRNIGFTLTANALNDQQNDSCDGYSLTNVGEKAVTEGTVATCW